jgi:uncharacterized protein YbdZ (MbtH family)
MPEYRKDMVYKGRSYIRNDRGYYKTDRLTPGEEVKLHRVIWVEHNGPIPAGMEVHHKDENKEHNMIENYQLLTKAAHARIHAGFRRLRLPHLQPCCHCPTVFLTNTKRKSCSQYCTTRAWQKANPERLRELQGREHYS